MNRGARSWFSAIACLAALVSAAQGLSGDALLARAERRVRAIDSMNHAFSGSFRQRVTSNSLFGADTIHIADSFAVHVRLGLQDTRTSLSSSTAPGMRMPPNTGSVFALRNAIFPFRAGTEMRHVEIYTTRLRDTIVDGRPCAVVFFDYHTRADSSRGRGAGRLWIALDDDTPVECDYDFEGRHVRRGDFISSVSIHTVPLRASVVIERNTTDVRFTLEDRELGEEHTRVVNSRFESD